MKRGTSVFLQATIVLIGIGAAAFLLWEPPREGRNAHATLFEVYFKDPFLAYAYVASIPFFVALRQAFKALGHAGRGRSASPEVLGALRTIRHCALAIIAFVVGGELIILSDVSDDRAGGVAMGVFIATGSIVVALAASAIEKNARKAIVNNPSHV